MTKVALKGFFCNVKDWKPDEDWNHFMFIRNNMDSQGFLIILEEKPKKSFKSLIEKVASRCI